MYYLVKTLIFALIFLSGTVFAAQENSNVEQLEQKLTSSKEDRVSTLVELVWIYRNNQFRRAMELGTEALELLNNNPQPELEARVLYSMAWAQMRVGNYLPANNLAVRSLKIAHAEKLREAEASATNVLGAIDWYQGNFLTALDYFLETLEIRIELGDKSDIAASYNNIGSVYQEINEYDKALKYHFLSLDLKQEVDDEYGTGASLFNISIIYKRLGNAPQELRYLTKALKIFLSMDDKEAITGARINLGHIKLKARELKLAAHYFQLSLDSARELNNQSFVDQAMLGLSKVELALNNHDEALKMALASLESAKELDEKTQIRDALELLSNIYQAKDKFDKALAYYKQYIEIRDEILVHVTQGQIDVLQQKFDKKQADIKISVLEKEKTLNQYKMEQSEKEKQYLFFTLLLGSLLGAVILFQYMRLAKKNKQNYVTSITDNLCDCYNRNYLFGHLLPELVEQKTFIYSVLIDIDHFKSINDEFGHSTGDRVLSEFSRRIGQQLKDDCHLIRLGGEEFLIIGFQEDIKDVIAFAEMIKLDVAENTFDLDDGNQLDITCSIGIACGAIHNENSIIEIIKQSDTAMYQAKKGGRNRVVC